MAVNYFKSLSWFNIIQFRRFSSWHWLTLVSIYLGLFIFQSINKDKQLQIDLQGKELNSIVITGGGKRKPSFKMVSNMVIQLLHTIKFSMEVPFSNMTQQPVEMQKTLTAKKVENISNPIFKILFSC